MASLLRQDLTPDQFVSWLGHLGMLVCKQLCFAVQVILPVVGLEGFPLM